MRHDERLICVRVDASTSTDTSEAEVTQADKIYHQSKERRALTTGMFELNHQSDHCVYRLDLTVWLAVQQASQEPGFLLEHAVLEVALDVLLTGVRVLLFSYGCKYQEIKV